LRAAFGLNTTGFLKEAAEALEVSEGGVPVVWFQGQSCNGCSVSLLNAIYYTTIDDLLLNKIDMEFHPTLMAAAGHPAVSAAEKAYRKGGYVFVVEGSVPTAASGRYCQLWPGLTMVKAVDRFAKRAGFIMAVGACASFGGVVHGAPNPTGAQGLADEYYGKRVIRIPSCPAHPDRVVGTVAHLLSEGTLPELDEFGRPARFYGKRVHDECSFKERYDAGEFVEELSGFGCLYKLGCKGRWTNADCPERRWHPGGPGEQGINWCIGAGSPCIGCTEPDFPDGKSPFFGGNE